MYNGIRFGLELGAYPNLLRVYEHCMTQPEFQAAQPHLQPDAGEYDPAAEY
jgi:maleylpyruvate isomerase